MTWLPEGYANTNYVDHQGDRHKVGQIICMQTTGVQSPAATSVTRGFGQNVPSRPKPICTCGEILASSYPRDTTHLQPSVFLLRVVGVNKTKTMPPTPNAQNEKPFAFNSSKDQGHDAQDCQKLKKNPENSPDRQSAGGF